MGPAPGGRFTGYRLTVASALCAGATPILGKLILAGSVGLVAARPREVRAAAGAAILLLVLGCASPPAPADPAPPPAPPPVEREDTVIGRTTQGRAIHCLSLGSGRETILILASIHGNESAGTPLVLRLADHLVENPGLLRGRRVLIVPVANPDGFARRRRPNARGVDLNRNFPTENFRPSRRSGRTPLSEPESRALFDLMTRDPPRCVVSIHQPLACIDFDGPGHALAARMAEASGLPLERIGGLPGSLGSWVSSKLERPIVTVELPKGCERWSKDELWERFGRILLIPLHPGSDPNFPIS